MKNIILDTDIGTDSDDIGAVSIACNLHRQGKINLLAITSTSSTFEPAYTIDLIAECYGVTVPIGKNEFPYGDDDLHGDYARKICKQYRSRLEGKEILTATKVLRKALTRGNVTLVTVGPLVNIANLLDSPADEISPLSGKELVDKNVTEMYVMAGTFVYDWTEFNVKENVASFNKVLSAVSCPITFIPWETGALVKTATNFLNGEDCPMKLGYYVHNGGPRESWDPITIYCATVECLPTSDWGIITSDEEGVTRYKQGNGNRRYVTTNFDVEEVTAKLEQLMVKI